MRNRSYLEKFVILLAVLSGLCFCTDKNEGVPESEMLEIQTTMAEKLRASSFSSDADLDIINAGLIYNETAIRLANKELERGKNTRMRNLAKELVAERSAENKDFKNLLNDHQLTLSSAEFHKQMLSSLERFEENSGLQVTGDIDKDFAAILILLNHAEIENFQLQQIYGLNAQIKAIGKIVIDKRDQQARYVQAWLSGNKNAD